MLRSDPFRSFLMKENTFQLLESVAKDIEQPIQECHVSDFNAVRLFKSGPKDPTFTRQVIFKRGKYRIAIYANSYILNVRLKAGKPKEPFLELSINNIDLICSIKKPSKFIAGAQKLPVYVSAFRQIDLEMHQKWLSDENVTHNINCLKLEKGESLSIIGADVILYCKARPLHEFQAMVDCLCSLARTIPTVVRSKFNLNKLPDEFHALIPLIEKWAIQDDVLREEKLAKTSAKVKEKVYRTVSPMFDKINEYLDSFGDGALPEEAVLLSAFAETVDEMGGKKGE